MPAPGCLLKGHIFLVVNEFFKQLRALLESASFLTGTSSTLLYVLRAEECTPMHRSFNLNNGAVISEAGDGHLTCVTQLVKLHGRRTPGSFL